MIKIKIHRGSHQIGGCSTEIEYEGERILIDLGSNLPGTDGDASITDKQLLDDVFGEKRDRHFDAILFSHYHGDHIGQYKAVPKGIPMYVGSAAKDIMKLIASYIDRDSAIKGEDILSKMETYKMGKPIEKLKKLKVTPLTVDHSALDAYMFLIEADGKKILFTGDFRSHGIANSKGQLWKTIDSYVGKKVDVLLSEGTMLSRVEEKESNIIQTEDELGLKAGEYFAKKKYNFVLVSSTNLDSIMEFYHNTPKDKMFVCDAYQAKMIMIAMIHKHKFYAKYQGKKEYGDFTKKIYIHGYISLEDYAWINGAASSIKKEGYPTIFFKMEKVADQNLDDGFVMLVRSNRFYKENGESPFEKIVREYREKHKENTQFIYSMWDGYLKGKTADENIIRITGGEEKVIHLHTSGHAYVETIAELMEKVNPDMVIPMHTEMAEGFKDFEEFAKWKNSVHELFDGEELCI